MSIGKIIFITGTSGAGKSTLKNLLEHLNSEEIKTHDFDEVGVPEDADHHWRIETTRNWLKYAIKNSKENRHTIIFGQSSPEEVASLADELGGVSISYGFIEIDEAIIRRRLNDRKWDPKTIEGNVEWAKTLKSQLQKQKKFVIYDGNDENESRLLEFFEKWIKRQISMDEV